MPACFVEFLPLLVLIGTAAGLVTGLFGVGGGLVLVPMLALILPALGSAPETVMQVAVGTSTAVVALSSIRSTRAHHARGGVRWPVLWVMAPGLALGALLGAVTAHSLPGAVLARFVGIGALVVAAMMWLEIEPHTTGTEPGAAGLGVGSAAIGWLSSLIGIGGGVLIALFLRLCGLGIRQAVGSSAAAAVPGACAGALGFVAVGWAQPGLPVGHLGYVWLPGFVVLSLVSIVVVPFGARVAHRLPQAALQRVFVLLPTSVGLVMLLSPP